MRAPLRPVNDDESCLPSPEIRLWDG
jgi:hypothetical protein